MVCVSFREYYGDPETMLCTQILAQKWLLENVRTDACSITSSPSETSPMTEASLSNSNGVLALSAFPQVAHSFTAPRLTESPQSLASKRWRVQAWEAFHIFCQNFSQNTVSAFAQ